MYKKYPNALYSFPSRVPIRGILGGVSVGMPIVARLAFKPTPSISIEQDSVDLKTMTPAKITVKGRHDRCVAFRGAVAAEAAMAIVLATELFG